jgi:purine nucleosidase
VTGSTERILLDTDIGSDIDDALCLAYLLARHGCELAGITTVSGEPGRRAAIASALCRAAGKDVPIHAGSPLPLLVEQHQPRAPQADALAVDGRVRWPHRTEFPPGTAVEFLRRTIREDPGNLTLLAIGPLTNLGLLFRIDPEIPSLLKRLVMMCGSFLGTPSRHGGAEWNALCDPHAASIVYATQVREHRSVGLDVTMQVSIDANEARSRFQRGLLRPVLDLAEVWFRGADRVVFHDPLAAVSIFEPGVCRFDRGTVGVEIAGGTEPGRTFWTPAANGPHEVAVTVDPPWFLRAFFGAFDVVENAT